MTSATPSSDPELSSLESGLFAFMRDGVIIDLTRVTRTLGVKSSTIAETWRCTTSTSDGVKLFESNVSALDAYMKAFSHLMLMKLAGKQIYSNKALRKRRQLGLD